MLVCVLPLDAVAGHDIDPSGAMGGMILFAVFAPLSTLALVSARYTGGPSFQKPTLICLSVLWLSPILVALLYFASRSFTQSTTAPNQARDTTGWVDVSPLPFSKSNFHSVFSAPPRHRMGSIKHSVHRV